MTLHSQAAADALLRTRGVSVIVPIHNAASDVERCLESLRRNSPREAEFLLIDDASTDPAIAALLQRSAGGEPRARVLTNEQNLGFTATVNRGLAETSGDVVLLNSDTEVPPRWLDNLRVAAYQRATIGTATPLSDNSGAFSAPRIDTRNETPAELSHDDVGRLIAQRSARRYPSAPSGGGFCMYIKRTMLDDIGYLDEEAFPRGYGEENDLSFRATAAGWEHVVDDATYVIHQRQASFGDEKPELVQAARAVLRERYPDFDVVTGRFAKHADMDAVRNDVAATFAAASSPVRPRVLSVVHAAGGGTPATARDLAQALHSTWDVWILETDGRVIRLLRPDGQRWSPVADTRLSTPISFPTLTDDHYRWFVTKVLSEHAFELVHIRHLIKHPLQDLTQLTTAFGIPYLVSFHDYYFVCPTLHLLDDRDRFCGGRCSPGQGVCTPPMPWLSEGLPHLKHGWVHTWKALTTETLKGAAGFVSASTATRDVVLHGLPELAELPFDVIEHGRDLERASLALSPADGEPIKVLVPGHLIGNHKGVHLLQQLREIDTEGRIELHLLGQVPERFASLGHRHGTYEREEFLDRVRDIGVSLALILSPSGETYCHTLTEAWAAGLPVVAADLGALRERIARHGGGLLVDPEDIRAVLAAITELATDPQLFARLQEDIDRMHLRTTTEMAREYDRLYRSVITSPGRLGSVSPTSGT